MNTVKSKDGTTIAFDKWGDGPAVIFVGGALNCRAFGQAELARRLAPQFTTYDYDRRGRGDSGDTSPYAVKREVEDIEALIDAAGGTACIYGHSSGAALAMEAAIQLRDKITRLAIYEPPYNADDKAQRTSKDYGKRLAGVLAAGRRTATGRRGEAIALFMEVVGTPPEQIEGMRRSPLWPIFASVAPTLAYDYAVLGDGAPVPVERAAGVRVPALVMAGGESYPFMLETAQALSRAMPLAELRTIEGQRHDVSQEVLAPVLAGFFSAG